MTGDDRITRARAALIMDQPWFGALALRLKVVAGQHSNANGPAPLWTDGSILGFDAAELVGISDGQLRTGIAHEVLHCALLHCFRAPAGVDWPLWCKATDYVVNALLTEAKFTPWPDWLLDTRFAGMSADQVYAILRREAAQSGGQGGSGGPGQSQPDMEPAPAPGTPGPASADPDDVQPAATAEDWAIWAEQAAMVGRRAGTMPGGTDRALGEVRKTTADWRAILREFVENVIPTDFTMVNPNRAYLATGLYMPGVLRESCPGLDVYMDVSSSTGAEWDTYGAELTAILHEVRPAWLRVLYVNTAVMAEQRFDPDDAAVDLRAPMGGGTAFQPAFDYVAASGELPAAGVYFTDLEGPAPKDPGWPVLWVTTAASRRVGPFGQTVRVPA